MAQTAPAFTQGGFQKTEAAALRRVKITQHMRPNQSDSNSLGGVRAPFLSFFLFLQVCLLKHESWKTVPLLSIACCFQSQRYLCRRLFRYNQLYNKKATFRSTFQASSVAFVVKTDGFPAPLCISALFFTPLFPLLFCVS